MKEGIEILSLKQELEQEKKYRDAMIQSNKDLEVQIKKLEAELQKLKKEDANNITGQYPNSEGYQRYQQQMNTNNKLDKDIALEKERLRIIHDSETDITDLNLDPLSQAELIRVVKQLERMKKDLQVDLHDTEFTLDQNAQEFAKTVETKKLYQAEIELRERKRASKQHHGSTQELHQNRRNKVKSS